MFYTIYKITNKTNGKVYIGSHKTTNLDDDYMGSGKYLLRAIEKQGKENFTKEILHVFDNPADMYAKEAELVNDEFLAEANTYNLKKGGYGGWDYINSNEENRIKKNQRARTATDNVLRNKYGENWRSEIAKIANEGITSESHRKRKETILSRYGENAFKSFSGKTHKEETKKKIGQANSIHQKGNKNSQFGTKWIYSDDLKLSKKIKNDENIPIGWKLGRKIKFN